MRVRMNARAAALGLPPLDGPPDADELAPSLLAVVAFGFVEIDGCVLLAAYEESARRTSVARCHDEVGYEAFVNHVHVDDLLPDGTPLDELLTQGAYYARRLVAELRREYPERGFRVLLGYGDSCVVRFHGDWPGQTYLLDDLESYDEAIAVVELP